VIEGEKLTVEAVPLVAAAPPEPTVIVYSVPAVTA
jgi:hypothetical protein